MAQENQSTEPSEDEIAAFVKKWRDAQGSEISSSQPFLERLVNLLRLPKPLAPGMEGADGYCYEKTVDLNRRIDLYKRDHFILEAKQGVNPESGDANQTDIFGDTPFAQARRKRNTAERGSGPWERAMTAAYKQANNYTHLLPEDENWPPFLIVLDIGYCFDIYANFSRNGRTYHPFPDARRKRIFVKDLDKPDVRETLRLIWTEPDALDPSLRSEKVTREISKNLGEMARSMEKQHPPALVSEFLMRCLFTMFAEDTNLLPQDSFKNLLDRHKKDPIKLQNMMDALWADMDKGAKFSPVIEGKVRHFNGQLFHDHRALLMKPAQIKILHHAAGQDWRDVEPAIFGTLLERALDSKERHKLGAHYTPRDYVERLVIATVIDPLRQDWAFTLAAAEQHAAAGDEKKARAEIESFHGALCETKILDPACGSGNFLYVALELMKRLEGEVLDALESYGGRAQLRVRELNEVSPDQFLGLELNPRAATIAEMVLWIGYLQWHMKNFKGAEPPDPVLREYGNVRHGDALMTWKGTKLRTDEKGKPVKKWDGVSRVLDMKTGREVPDVSKQVEDYIYVSPAPAKWPTADFIVGNPPFQGGKDLRKELGDGYTEALWGVYSELPNSADFVMYWWHKAAELVRAGKARRFGLITTNSITQAFSRRVIELHAESRKPLSIFYAVPDHPWIDSADGAAVRISMTIGVKGDGTGRLFKVVNENAVEKEGRGVTIELAAEGKIRSNLRVGANLSAAKELRANERICSPGVKLHGDGFIVTAKEAEKMGLGARPEVEDVILPYLNGNDLMQKSRGKMVIDLFGLEAEEVRDRYPGIYQHIRETVWPERKQNRRKTYRENWWIFGEPRSELRKALNRLPRYIATAETAKHRVFVFLDAAVRPDNMLVNIGLDDAYGLGVLSSRIHVVWALATGGRLEDRPRYQKSLCFDTFPFPETDAKTKAKIRKLSERLDKHRKDRQAEHPNLGLTDMYNVLEALRGDGELTLKERGIKDQGLVQVLKELHDELDAAVAEAYGWPADLSDEEILENLVALNLARADEEAKGEVRWLRPEFQHPTGAAVKERRETIDLEEGLKDVVEQAAWPKTVKERIAAIRAALDEAQQPLSADNVAAAFKRAKRAEVRDLLETLADMGVVRYVGDDKFV
ncbi:MAG: class I SAM-dependent DNA methyltransferase [Rhodospirillales bacterium]